MDIILAPPQVVTLATCERTSTSDIRFKSAKAKINISLPDGATNYANRYIKFLKQLPMDFGQCQDIEHEMVIVVGVKRQIRRGCISVFSPKPDSYMDVFFKLLGDRVKNMTADIDFKLTSVEATQVHSQLSVTDTKYQVSENEQDGITGLTVGCFAVLGCDIDESFQRSFFTSNVALNGTFSMKLKFNDETLNFLQLKRSEDRLSINRKILNEAISTDAVIVTGCGVNLNCHKVFLAAHSPVFSAMFESTMKEGLTGTVHISEMTEAGVRALLTYLYYSDTTEASKSSSIALELLIAADKYNIGNLEVEVRELLLSMDDNLFGVDVALQLLQFVRRKMDSADCKWNHNKMMERKATSVIKSKSEAELKDCPEFQELFSEPEAGIDFFAYLLTNGNKRFKKS